MCWGNVVYLGMKCAQCAHCSRGEGPTVIRTAALPALGTGGIGLCWGW